MHGNHLLDHLGPLRRADRAPAGAGPAADRPPVDDRARRGRLVLDIADSDEFDFGSFLIAVGTSVLLLWLYLRYFAERDRRAVT